MNVTLVIPSRNNLKYVINQMPKGLYEVVIKADSISNYLYDGIPGAYFQFNAGEMALNIEKVSEFFNTTRDK